MFNLNDKYALVTGASRGIGHAISSVLAQQGAYVIGTATTEEGAAAITQGFEQAQLKGEGIVLDVANKESIDSLMKQLSSEEKIPSILVNNAGITRDNLLLTMDDEEWDDVIETNLNSVFHLTKAFLRSMVRGRWGRIINIGSVVASSGNPGQTNYAAAKAGLLGFTRSLAREIASRNITVNVVAPGFIETDMTTKLPDMVKEEILKRVPMKRLGKAEDIAHMVAFLASDYGNYITGEIIHINGGMYMD